MNNFVFFFQVDSNNSATPESQSNTSFNKEMPSSDSKTRQYTPPVSNSLFARRVKSPRRLLLAKRALLAKDKHDDVLSQRKSSSHRYQPTACQCYGKPQICSLCTARYISNIVWDILSYIKFYNLWVKLLIRIYLNLREHQIIIPEEAGLILKRYVISQWQ